MDAWPLSLPSRLSSGVARLVAVAVFASACGEVPSPVAVEPQRFERLDFDLVPGSTPIGDEVVSDRFYLPADVGHWAVDSPARRFAPLPGTSTRTLLVKSGADEGPITLTRTGEFDLGAIDTVRLVYTFRGLGWVSVGFLEDGELVHRAPRVFLEETDAPAPISVPLELAGKTGTCDRLQIICGSKSLRALRVVSVETLATSPGRLLPSASGPPRATALDGSSRLAERLVSGRPLETWIDVGARAELRFSYARPTPTSDDASLVVTLRDVDGEVVAEERYERPIAAKTWTAARLDLSEFAGRLVSVRVALEGSGVAWLFGEAQLVGPTEDARPDVLFVTSDTHRADHVGFAGAGDVATPAIDALAREGVVFLDCAAPSNVTNPSHIAMMTGVPPRDTGILVNRLPLAARAQTLAELFADAGYVTLASLAVAHIGHDGSGLGQGFDRMDWPHTGSRDAVEVVDLAARRLDECDGAPVFLWVHVFDAHWPYAPPEPYDRMHYRGPADPFDPSLPRLDVPDQVLPPDMQGLRTLDFPRAQYRAEISYLDDQLARLLDLPALRDAIVALTSDHGEGLGESGVWFNHGELYPGALRVPLVLRWPGGPRDVRIAEPVSNLDVGATLVALAGLDAATFPGRDLSALVGDETAAAASRFALSSNGLSASLQDGDRYCILHLVAHDTRAQRPAFERHEVELYDLRADPACRRDLVDVELETAAAMRARLVEWLRAASGDLRGEANASAEFLEQLTALGYVDQEAEAATVLWEDDDCAWCRLLDGR